MAAMTAPQGADDDVERWLQLAFSAERAPRPCRLPAPVFTQAPATPPRAVRHRGPPVVRPSFVLMLALSASGLLLTL